MELIDVVRKLVGPIEPVGETHTDDRRFENLEALTELVDRLIFDIDHIATAYKNNHQASMQRAAKHCDKFLDELGIPKD